MRQQDEIFTKYVELSTRKLRERMEKFLGRGYVNCIHNVRLNVRDNGKVGFCQNPELLSERKKVLVCNDDAFCLRCRHYHCKHTPEMVRDEFDAIISSPARCGEEYPKLAVLIWVLQGKPGIDNMKPASRGVLGLFRRFLKLG